MELLIILEGEGEDREGGREDGGMEGEGGSSLVVEPHPRAAHQREGLLASLSQFIPCCSIFAAQSD